MMPALVRAPWLHHIMVDDAVVGVFVKTDHMEREEARGGEDPARSFTTPYSLGSQCPTRTVLILSEAASPITSH